MRGWEAQCPGCGAVLNAVIRSDMAADEAGPQPGAVNICAECSVISIFDDDLHLRLPTVDELVAFRGEVDGEMIADIDACIAAVRAFEEAEIRRN